MIVFVTNVYASDPRDFLRFRRTYVFSVLDVILDTLVTTDILPFILHAGHYLYISNGCSNF